MSTNFVVISGCSGGGKSTLLDELASRGHHVVQEPGRRIVAEQRSHGSEHFLDAVSVLRHPARLHNNGD